MYLANVQKETKCIRLYKNKIYKLFHVQIILTVNQQKLETTSQLKKDSFIGFDLQDYAQRLIKKNIK